MKKRRIGNVRVSWRAVHFQFFIFNFQFRAGAAIGRGERIRTSDPLVPNQVRYQTALHPDAAAGRGSRVTGCRAGPFRQTAWAGTFPYVRGGRAAIHFFAS
jgi:hypothetical protein